MLHPRELAVFLAVVDSGSVSGAAQAGFLSQPTVSRQIAALERESGVRLFRRTPTGMELTPAGERLEPLARDLVKRARRAAEVMAAAGSMAPSFTVACPETTGNFFVAGFVAAGGAVADIQPALPADVYGRLRLGADLAINTAAPPRGLRGMEIAQLQVRCAVRADHPLAQRSKVELKEIVAEPFLMPGGGSAVERVVRQRAERAGLGLELAKLASNGRLAQALTAAGHGPALVVESAFFDLTTIPLRHRGEPLVVRFYAAWERSHYASEEIARLANDFGRYMDARIRESDLAPSDEA